MIIVSLTTIPERLEKGLPINCIKTLLKQSLLPDRIFVNIPTISKKGVPYNLDLASKLEELSPIVKVINANKDYGPVTKIIPTLLTLEQEFTQTNDIQIILVDDDCFYNFNLVETLTTLKRRNPTELVIGTSGRIKSKTVNYATVNGSRRSDNFYADIIEAFPGVLYDYTLFKGKTDELLRWISTLPEFVMLADDIILSFWAKKQGAKLLHVRQDISTLVVHDPQNTTELNHINDRAGNNDRVYEYLYDRTINKSIDKLIVDSANNSFAKFVEGTIQEKLY